MKKWLLIGICGVSFGAAAQLIDLLGAGAVGGAQSVGSVQSVSRTLSIMQQNKIIQNIHQLVMNIKIDHINGYQGLNKADYQGMYTFQGVQWDIQSIDGSHFYLVLDGIDMSACRKLVEMVQGAQTVLVNNQTGKSAACSQKSQIKWIFE